MNKQALQNQYGFFKLVHGVTLRLIGVFSDEDLSYRPRPEMRSVHELILHMYGMMRIFSEAMHQGKLTAEMEYQVLHKFGRDNESVSGLKTITEVQDFARESFKIINEALAGMTNEKLLKLLGSPFGTFPMWQYFIFCYLEHWHHRGQLYTYARLVGKEPPYLFDYENSPA